jgi:hypothetical protein
MHTLWQILEHKRRNKWIPTAMEILVVKGEWEISDLGYHVDREFADLRKVQNELNSLVSV